MYLLDTNIALEILLAQEKKETCKSFLNQHIGQLAMSDFSLHSIGVILFRYKKKALFHTFSQDIADKISIKTLSIDGYAEMEHASDKTGLDFDDTYQFCIAKKTGLKIVTMDKDFEKVQQDIDVLFL